MYVPRTLLVEWIYVMIYMVELRCLRWIDWFLFYRVKSWARDKRKLWSKPVSKYEVDFSRYPVNRLREDWDRQKWRFKSNIEVFQSWHDCAFANKTLRVKLRHAYYNFSNINKVNDLTCRWHDDTPYLMKRLNYSTYSQVLMFIYFTAPF